jgi:hypothetical protein
MIRGPSRGKLIAMAIAIVGIGAALLGVYVLKTQRPVAGAVIRTITLPDGVITLRAEQGGARHFIEYRDARLSWQALIPPYAGADGTEALSYDDRVMGVGDIRSLVRQRAHVRQRVAGPGAGLWRRPPPTPEPSPGSH